MKALHQHLKHRYILNKSERTIVHKFFDDELVDKKNNKKTQGKWVSKGSIPASPVNAFCKCGGQFYVPVELPEIFDLWGLCSKCGAEL